VKEWGWSETHMGPGMIYPVSYISVETVDDNKHVARASQTARFLCVCESCGASRTKHRLSMAGVGSTARQVDGMQGRVKGRVGQVLGRRMTHCVAASVGSLGGGRGLWALHMGMSVSGLSRRNGKEGVAVLGGDRINCVPPLFHTVVHPYVRTDLDMAYGGQTKALARVNS